MKSCSALILLLVLSCKNPVSKQVTHPDTVQFTKEPVADVIQAPTFSQTGYFVDSAQIGRKGRNKVEITISESSGVRSVTIQFHSRQKGAWFLSNRFVFEKDDMATMDPRTSDFNHDGLMDLTYQSSLAARGANEVRRLFIYDPAGDSLVYVKNSEDYPNLLYNQDLDCIDAWLIYGGCSTVFLHLRYDSLIPFASVELDDGLKVYEYGPSGVRKEIYQDSSVQMGYARYRNYKPLKEYEDYRK